MTTSVTPPWTASRQARSLGFIPPLTARGARAGPGASRVDSRRRCRPSSEPVDVGQEDEAARRRSAAASAAAAASAFTFRSVPSRPSATEATTGRRPARGSRTGASDSARDAADEAEVDPVDRAGGTRPRACRRPRPRARRRGSRASPQLGDERLVDEARENRDDDVERLGVGDAQAAVGLLRDVERLQRARRSACRRRGRRRCALPRSSARRSPQGRARGGGVLEEAPAELDDDGSPTRVALTRAPPPRNARRAGSCSARPGRGRALEQVVEDRDDDGAPAARQHGKADLRARRAHDVAQLGELARRPNAHERRFRVRVAYAAATSRASEARRRSRGSSRGCPARPGGGEARRRTARPPKGRAPAASPARGGAYADPVGLEVAASSANE